MSEKRYELHELLGLMKANKLTHLKLGGMELEMHPSAFETPSTPATPAEPEDVEKMPSQDEMLYGAGLVWVPDEQPEGEA